MPQNTKTNIIDRRNKVAEYYFKGKKQFEIAELLNVTAAQISYDLKHLREVWINNSVAKVDGKIAEELAKIDNLEKSYWEAWEKSTRDHNKVTTKSKGKAGAKAPDLKEVTDTEVIKDGEPRFLQGVERCIERRCKLLGLDAPKKIKHLEDENSFIHFLMNTQVQ